MAILKLISFLQHQHMIYFAMPVPHEGRTCLEQGGVWKVQIALLRQLPGQLVEFSGDSGELLAKSPLLQRIGNQANGEGAAEPAGHDLPFMYSPPFCTKLGLGHLCELRNLICNTHQRSIR